MNRPHRTTGRTLANESHYSERLNLCHADPCRVGDEMTVGMVTP
jgi:hypothetical protein